MFSEKHEVYEIVREKWESRAGHR